MRLSYKAVDETGKIFKGDIEAKDNQEAVIYLRNRKLTPVAIFRTKENDIVKYIPFLKKANTFDLVFFTRQMSSMISSGLTLIQSLNVLKNQTNNSYMVGILNSLVTDIEGGSSFSQALEKFPEIFSPVFISLIKAAEQSGLFDKVLLRLSDNLEKQQKLRQNVRSALVYPIIVVIGMSIVGLIMTLFVIPQFSGLYKSLNVSLPFSTVIVISISRFMITFWPAVIGFVIGFVALYKRWVKTEPGRLAMDTIILKVPVFGNIIKESILTEFTRTLGILTGSGSLIVEALNQTANSAGNMLYKNAIIGVAQRVEKGLPIGDAFSVYALFPPILIQTVRIGDQTGKLDESLIRVSEYFEREVDVKVKNLTTLMEPLIIVMLGLGVAFLIFSVITPIYSLIGSIQ